MADVTTKYRNMLNAGVMPEAVRQSMAMDGHDPSQLFAQIEGGTLNRQRSFGFGNRGTKPRGSRAPAKKKRSKKVKAKNGTKPRPPPARQTRAESHYGSSQESGYQHQQQQQQQQYQQNTYASQGYGGEQGYYYNQQGYSQNAQNHQSNYYAPEQGGNESYHGNGNAYNYNQYGAGRDTGNYEQEAHHYQQQGYDAQASQSWYEQQGAQQQQQEPQARQQTQYERARASAYPSNLRATQTMTAAEKEIYEAESMGSSTRATMAKIQDRAGKRRPRRRNSSKAETGGGLRGTNSGVRSMMRFRRRKSSAAKEKFDHEDVKKRVDANKKNNALSEEGYSKIQGDEERRRNSPNQEEARTQDPQVRTTPVCTLKVIDKKQLYA